MLVQKWGFPELSISSRGFGGKGGVDWLNCRGGFGEFDIR